MIPWMQYCFKTKQYPGVRLGYSLFNISAFFPTASCEMILFINKVLFIRQILVYRVSRNWSVKASGVNVFWEETKLLQ